VIAATNVNLQEAVREGVFREDLYYRLNVISIRIPPLRERLEDIPLLAHHFVEQLSLQLGKRVEHISEAGLRLLMSHNWPGNVRELENVIERAMVTCRNSLLTEEDFQFLAHELEERKVSTDSPVLSLREMERQAIEAALRRTQGNMKEAASVLGIDRSTLYEKIKKYEIAR